MSIVTFHRQGDAALAKAKYDGRYIDHSSVVAHLFNLKMLILILLITRTANQD